MLEKLLHNFINKSSTFYRLELDTHDAIFMIVDQLTTIVYNKPVKIKIYTTNLTDVIINVIVRYYDFF